MTHFLSAGIFNDRLKDIYETATQLEQLLGAAGEEAEAAREQVHKIKTAAGELLELIQSFSCQPLIYTGNGNTEEIITRLDWLLTFAGTDASPSSPQTTRPKRRRKTKKIIPTGKR